MLYHNFMVFFLLSAHIYRNTKFVTKKYWTFLFIQLMAITQPQKHEIIYFRPLYLWKSLLAFCELFCIFNWLTTPPSVWLRSSEVWRPISTLEPHHYVHYITHYRLTFLQHILVSHSGRTCLGQLRHEFETRFGRECITAYLCVLCCFVDSSQATTSL
jgi:hypothetical protein